MSRIGSKQIDIPAGVEVSVKDDVVTVKGSRGSLDIAVVPHISVAVQDGKVVVSRDDDNAKAFHGLVRSLINNAVYGVVNGYKKELAIVGTGYKATLAGQKLTLNVGYSHPIDFMVPAGIKMTVTDGVKILIEGFDKQLVGEVAARIRRFKKPEPYKGKGIRYADEHVVIKPGKTNA